MTVPYQEDPVVYLVDEEDRITFLSDSFTRFAMDNDAPHLVGPTILGQRLWDHITEPTTAELYQAMLARVRQEGAALAVPIRCDGPHIIRKLSVEMWPMEADGVRFVSKPVELTPRQPNPVLDIRSERNDRLIRLCSWCKCVHVEGQGWMEADRAVHVLGLFQQMPLPRITHGICQNCAKGVLEQVRELPATA